MPILIGTSTEVNDVPYRNWLPTEQNAPTLSREQFNAVSMNIYNRVNGSDVGRGAWEHVGRWALGTGIDLADSVWSTPLNPFGDRGDVWSLASAEQQEFYQRNKGLIEGSSALAGGVLTAVAAEALVIPKIAAAMGTSAAITGSAAWTAAKAWNINTRIGMMAAQRTAAAAGESFSLIGSQAGRAFLANRAVAGAAVATRTVPIDYAVMWNNEAFNSGEWSKEGFWIGVGGVLGGSIGAIGARAVTRKVANSADMRDMRAQAFAMSGASNDLLSPDHLDMANRITAQGVQLKESAMATEFLLASRSANPKGYDEAAENATRLNSMRNNYMNLAKDSMQKIVQKGISGVDTLKGPVKEIPEVENIVKGLAKHDPFVIHGVSEMGLINVSVKEARKTRAAFIDSVWKQSEVMEKQGNLKEAQRLARLQRTLKLQDDFLLVNGSWMRPESELAEAVAEFKPDLVLSKVLPTKGAEGIHVALPGRGGKALLDASLNPLDGRGAAIDAASLSIKDRLVLNEAASSMVRRLTSKDAKTKFKLTESSAKSWFSLDLAAEVIDRGGAIEFAAPKLKLNSVEDIKRESLKLKARAALKELGATGRITDEVRFRYNLPAALAMEKLEDPAGDSFRLWLEGAARDEGSLREVSQALSDSRAIRGIDLLPANGTPTIRVDGDMTRFNRNERGTWMKPMMGYFDRDSLTRKISEGAHREATILKKAETTAVLMRNQTHVGQLSRDLVQMPELQQAMNTQGLHNDQLTGLGGGAQQVLGEFLPKRFRYRDNETVLAATKIQERASNHGLANFKGMMDSVGMQDEVTMLTSAGNSGKRVLLDQYASIRSGWDLDDAVPLGDGKFGFKLLDTEGNRRRLGMSAGDEWVDELLTNQRLNKPVVVDGDGLRIIQKFNKLTEAIRESDNVLRAAKGLEPIKSKAWYTPPPDTKGALVGFVYGPDDKMIPGRTIVANSPEEWNLLHRRTLEELGNGHTIRTKDQLESLRDVWDEVAMDWIDPGIHPATTGIGNQKGGLVGAYVKDGAFMEMLDWVKRKSIAQSQDTVKQLMHEPLLTARAQGAAERSANPNKEVRNVFDEYEMALTGQSKVYQDTAKVDKIFRSAEKFVDSVLANSSLTAPGRYFVDLAQRVGMNPMDLKGKTTYKAIAKELGDYTPYSGVTEFMESRGIKRPPTVKNMAGSLNTMASSVLLRWFELPHAAMNLLGLVATIPATVSAGRAPITTFLNVKGKDVGMLDGARIISQAAQDMFKAKSGADWKHMVRMGDSGQSVMEYHQQLGAIQSQAGFMKWAKEADKWVSIATDTTENWSRQFSHFVGLRLADYHGIQGMAARHDFAREIANAAIADYAPVNRPELFGSGFGSLFGLFQSYALNHYTKMFRWMENGQYKQFGLQAATQATLFGVPGTYGMGQLFDLRDSMLNENGADPTAVDLIYEHFGPVLGGAIVHGSVSQITQLALWSRGDTNFRVPGASGTVPALDVGTKVARGFVDAVSGFMNAMPGEGTHAAMEAIQRNMPNRVMRSWLTLLNDGREVDAYGQTMTDTQGWLSDTVARVVGLRSARQQSELEAFYASRAGMERDAGKMETLRESFRSAVRRNNGNVEDVNPIQYFNDYVKAGGNPKMFKTWVTNLLRDSGDARSAQQLRKSLATPRSALELWRYSAYGAWEVN